MPETVKGRTRIVGKKVFCNNPDSKVVRLNYLLSNKERIAQEIHVRIIARQNEVGSSLGPISIDEIKRILETHSFENKSYGDDYSVIATSFTTMQILKRDIRNVVAYLVEKDMAKKDLNESRGRTKKYLFL